MISILRHHLLSILMHPSGKIFAMTFIKVNKILMISAVFLLLAVNLASVIAAGDLNRPKNVPTTAIWVGGPDGGVWIVLRRSDKDPPGTYRAKVYYQSGDLEYQGPLVLRPNTSKPFTLNPAEFEGWDGDEILLGNGRSLKIP